MPYFLRKAPVLMASVAAVGSSLIYSNTPTDFKTSVQTLIPARDTLLCSWMNMRDMVPQPSFFSLDPSRFENFPFFFSRFASAESSPLGDTKKEASSEDADGVKPCCECLGKDTIANAVAKVGPAVVKLSVPEKNTKGYGTIIDKNGTIVTCFHVVAGASKSLNTLSNSKVEVTFHDGRIFEGTVINPYTHPDIAIVKINTKFPLPSAKFGSSRKLRPGEWVVAVGCPFPFQKNITAGIVSCVDFKGYYLGLEGSPRDYLHTNCAINEGNWGGPLVNMDGEVVGVNIMTVELAGGIGISAPIDDAVSKSLEHIKTKGRVVIPWLGLRILDLNDMVVADMKERNPAFPSVDEGGLVVMVVPGSPAERSGFRPGDVVVEFDGITYQSVDEFLDILLDKAGKPINVRVKRSNNVSVTLTVISDEASDDF